MLSRQQLRPQSDQFQIDVLWSDNYLFWNSVIGFNRHVGNTINATKILRNLKIQNFLMKKSHI